MEEFSDLNLTEDEAFVARMRLGELLGKLKDWTVIMGQLPYGIYQMIESIKSEGPEQVELDGHQAISLLTQVLDYTTQGMENLVTLIQKYANEHFGEPFSNDSFVYNGNQLFVASVEASSVENIAHSLDDLPEEMREETIKKLKEFSEHEDMPEDMRDAIKKFLEGEE